MGSNKEIKNNATNMKVDKQLSKERLSEKSDKQQCDPNRDMKQFDGKTSINSTKSGKNNKSAKGKSN